MTASQQTLAVRLANDLGYGAIKATYNGIRLKVPSVVAVEREQDFLQPLDFNQFADREAYMNHLLDHLDFSIQSNQVKMTQRMLFGQAAVDSHLDLTSFDVNDMSGKAEQDLAVILTLGLLAGEGVKLQYQQTHQFQTELTLKVTMATALPIVEGKMEQTVDAYRKRFLTGTHIVTIHNFTDLITVHIKFEAVQVALEGETAQYQIANANQVPQLAKDIQTDLVQHYPSMQGIKPVDIYSIRNVLGIDIGEGTTDFIVFHDAAVNTQVSMSLAVGYGSALEDAILDLQAQRFNIKSRAELQDFVHRPTNPMIQSKQQHVKQIVARQLQTLSQKITSGMSKVLNRLGASGVDIIYVYGGGAIPLAQTLRPLLVAKTKAFNAGSDIPVIFIDAQYSQYLNEMGLDLILKYMEQMIGLY